MMELANALVVYFSIGVPFGVMSIAMLRGRLEAVDVLHVLYNLTFWPGIVMLSFLRVRTGSAHSIRRHGASDRRANAGNLRQTLLIEIENISDRRQRRKMLSRLDAFEGLSHAYQDLLNVADEQPPQLAVSDFRKPAITAKCFQRRNAMKIRKHLKSASGELISFLPSSSTLVLNADPSDSQSEVFNSGMDPTTSGRVLR